MDQNDGSALRQFSSSLQTPDASATPQGSPVSDNQGTPAPDSGAGIQLVNNSAQPPKFPPWFWTELPKRNDKSEWERFVDKVNKWYVDHHIDPAPALNIIKDKWSRDPRQDIGVDPPKEDKSDLPKGDPNSPTDSGPTTTKPTAKSPAAEDPATPIGPPKSDDPAPAVLKTWGVGPNDDPGPPPSADPTPAVLKTWGVGPNDDPGPPPSAAPDPAPVATADPAPAAPDPAPAPAADAVT